MKRTDAEEVKQKQKIIYIYIYILKAQTVAATLMQPCLARNTLLYHLLYKYTACFLNLEIQCYSEIHLNIMHTHYAQLTIGKEEEERKQDLTEKY